MINKLTAIVVVFMASLLFAAPAFADDKRIGILVFDKVLTSDVIACLLYTSPSPRDS